MLPLSTQPKTLLQTAVLCGLLGVRCGPTAVGEVASTNAGQPVLSRPSAASPAPAQAPWTPPVGEVQPAHAPPDPPIAERLSMPPLVSVRLSSVRERLGFTENFHVFLFADLGERNIERGGADNPCRVEVYAIGPRGTKLSDVRRLSYDSAGRLVQATRREAPEAPDHERVSYKYDGDALVETSAYDLEKPSPDNPSITLIVRRLGYDAHGANVYVDVEAIDEREPLPGDRYREDWTSVRYDQDGFPVMSSSWMNGKPTGYTRFSWRSGDVRALSAFSSNGTWRFSEEYTYDASGRHLQSVIRRRMLDGRIAHRIILKSYSSEGELAGITSDADGDGVPETRIAIVREANRTAWETVKVSSGEVVSQRIESRTTEGGGKLVEMKEKLGRDGTLLNSERTTYDAEGRVERIVYMRDDDRGTRKLFFYECK